MPAAAVHIELVFSRPETTQSVTRGAARLMADMGLSGGSGASPSSLIRALTTSSASAGFDR